MLLIITSILLSMFIIISIVIGIAFIVPDVDLLAHMRSSVCCLPFCRKSYWAYSVTVL